MANRDLQPEEGSEAARMADLYKQNLRPLYLFIRSRVDTREQAEDLAAEAFMKAFKNLAKFKAQAEFKTWLFTIARNLVIDWYRSQQRWRFLPSSSLNENAPADQEREQVEENDQAEVEVRVILKSLNEDQAQVLSLRFLSNLSIKETAAVMQISEANVKVIQHRALKKAQDLFKNHD